MPKNYPVNFRIHIPEPVEVKMVTANIAERDDIDFYERFKGLFTYVVEEDIFYYLSGGVTNGHWKPINTPGAIEILDVFDGSVQKLISGHGIKKYLEDNYVTKQELQQAINEVNNNVPDHVKNITQGDINEWDSKESDKHYKHIQSEAKITWVINHRLGKLPSIAIFLPDGQRVFGDERHIDLNLSSVSFSKAISGIAILN